MKPCYERDLYKIATGSDAGYTHCGAAITDMLGGDWCIHDGRVPGYLMICAAIRSPKGDTDEKPEAPGLILRTVPDL